MKYVELNEASEKEKHLGELAGIELATAMDKWARKKWDADAALQKKHGEFSKYLLACSKSAEWRKDFFTKYMAFVERSFDQKIQDLTK